LIKIHQNHKNIKIDKMQKTQKVTKSTKFKSEKMHKIRKIENQNRQKCHFFIKNRKPRFLMGKSKHGGPCGFTKMPPPDGSENA